MWSHQWIIFWCSWIWSIPSHPFLFGEDGTYLFLWTIKISASNWILWCSCRHSWYWGCPKFESQSTNHLHCLICLLIFHSSSNATESIRNSYFKSKEWVLPHSFTWGWKWIKFLKFYFLLHVTDNNLVQKQSNPKNHYYFYSQSFLCAKYSQWDGFWQMHTQKFFTGGGVRPSFIND